MRRPGLYGENGGVGVCVAVVVLLLLAGQAAFAQTQQGGAALPTEDPAVGALHPMLAEVVEAGPYRPQWSSLVEHPLPDWFKQDKIGLSAHWGPYAVPGWTAHKDTPYGVAYAEWYRMWIESNDVVRQYHQQTYDGVHYDAFINGTPNLKTGETEGFFTKDFDADAWMKLFKQAGVKYFFITAKHHDGFCLWDTAYTDRNAMKMGPKRDLLRELVDAARANGIRIGFYYSYYEWHNPYYTGKDRRYDGLKDLPDADGDGKLNEYVDDYMVPQIKELIDHYQPDYLCFDGEWDRGYVYWRSRQIVAYYYNQAARRGQQVLINDRFGGGKDGTTNTRGVYGDFYHVEYTADVDRKKPWAMWRGFGNSYGYNRNEPKKNILSIRDSLRLMVDVVADNGNVEFNLGPKADGTLAGFEVERLEAMGRWLSVNGQAIYGTTASPIGRPAGWRCTHRAENSRLYLHVYDWPADGVLKVQGIANEIKSTSLLASGQELVVEDPGDGSFEIQLPKAASDPDITVIAVDYVGPLRVDGGVE